jgi:hypothetical protein
MRTWESLPERHDRRGPNDKVSEIERRAQADVQTMVVVVLVEGRVTYSIW